MLKKEISQQINSILETRNLIAGQWFGEGTGTVEVTDKYHQSLLAEVPLASADQVEQAIAAAATAAKEFRAWDGTRRRSHLERLLELFQERAEAFAWLIAAEAGKPIGYAKGEVQRCQTTLRLAMEEITRFSGEVVNVDYDAGRGRTAYTKRVPIGPISGISPFNFPLNLALHKIAPALAVGCPVVLKPSPFAPLTCLAFARLCQEAGYPPGFINIFLAGIPEAEKIVVDDRLKLFSFTGSPQVGWMLKSKAGKKPVILELGGNAVCIVEETADLDVAAKRIAIGSFLYAGQICISTQRILVQESIWDDFKELLIRETEKLSAGDPFEPEVSVGPMIASEHLERIAAWVNAARNSGAEVWLGGEILDRDRNLYPPTILSGVPGHLEIVCEEAFGPVAVVDSFGTFDEAIQKANDTRFGLQAGLFTNRLDLSMAAHSQIEVAGLIINDVPGFRVDGMPYGGIKDSGLGREGIRYAMEDMTEPRLMVINQPNHQ